MPYQCPTCRKFWEINTVCPNCNYSYGLHFEDELIGGATMDQWDKKMAFEEESPKKNSSSSNDENVGEGPGAADMKNLLGYLNQSEWIFSLNIGNIMQIAPLTMQDFMSVASIELELSREYVLEKVKLIE